MNAVDTIINARWVIPVDSSNRVLDHFSVALSDNRIHSILPTKDAETQFSNAEKIELSTHALIPGLINVHTHAAMTLFRSVAEDLPLEDWLQERVWPLESQWVSEDFVRDGTRLALAEMIRGGTTCMNDMYMFPEVVGELARCVGMRTCIGMIVLEFPSAWADTSEEYLNRGIRVRERFMNEPLISVMLAPHAPYTVHDRTFETIAALSASHNLRVHMHVHETATEVQTSLTEHGVRPIERLRRLGLINSRLLAIHATQLTGEEIELLADSHSSVVHCPKSNLKFANGICPVAKLQQHQVNLAIGTDGAASNNSLDMIEEMRFASLLAKVFSGQASEVSVRDALRMATINGARCLGLEREIGSLEAGKLADITALDLNDANTVPVYDPVAQIVHAAGRNQVTDVWIDGRRVLHNRTLTSIDEAECIEIARRWGERINSRT